MSKLTSKKPKTTTVQSSGKRKEAVARAIVKPGKGLVRINSIIINNYGSNIARLRIMEPLQLAGDLLNKINIDVIVNGGGFMSQAEAARLAVARGIVLWSGSEELKSKFLKYDRNLLVADARTTEPHKPCRSSARRGKQTSKR